MPVLSKTNIMTNYFKIVLIGFLTYGLSIGQLKAQNKEIAIRTSGIDNFDFVFKKELSENRLLRYRLIVGRFNFSESSDNNSQTSINAGFAMGLEKRKSINDKLMFIHGFEPSIFFQFSSSEVTADSTLNSNTIISPSLGYVLGFQYSINSNFYINVEAIPSIYFNSRSQNDETTYNFGAGFSSNAVALTFAYCFTK